MQSTVQLFATLGAMIGAPAAPVTMAAAPPAANACTRCKGSGRYFAGTRDLGECFACKGAGKIAPKAAPVTVAVTDDALRAMFDKLRDSGLSRIKLRMNGFQVKPAKAAGKNPGALYVAEGDTYLGKIINSKFERASVCNDETAAKVAALVSDPMAAIKATGQLVGSCCVCGLTLTDPVSVEIGIGPICRERLGA